MDQSLDDIIKSKHIKPNFRNRPGSQSGKPQNPSQKTLQKLVVLKTANRIPQNGRAKVIDARQKIIDKTRSTVIDARSRITQKDARLKLNKVQESKNSRITKSRDLRGRLNSRTSPVLRPIGILQRTVQSDVGYRGLGPPTITMPIQRTIRNNFTPSYGGPTGGRAPVLSHLDMEWADLDSPVHVDPVVRPDPHLYRSSSSDLYYNPMEVLSTRTIRNDLLHIHESSRGLPRRSPPRSLSPPSHGILSRLDSSHSHELSRSRPSAGILSRSTSERRGTGSAGILGSSSRHVEAPSQSAQIQPGHRIVVSNLKDSVNSDDIKELFEDIGPLIASRVVRPGTAEVIYVRQSDAIKAVETYHNRQLDKQPMKCMLVTSRVSANPLEPAAPKLPTATKSNTVQPDLAAVYKALFNKPSQMYK